MVDFCISGFASSDFYTIPYNTKLNWNTTLVFFFKLLYIKMAKPNTRAI